MSKLYYFTLPPKEHQDMMILSAGTKESNVKVFRIDNSGMVEVECNIQKFPVTSTGSRGVVRKEGILVCGGSSKLCYTLRPGAASWTSFPPMPAEAWNFGLIQMRDGVFAIGGPMGEYLYYFGKWMNIAKGPRIPLSGGSTGFYGYGCSVKLDENRIMQIGGAVRMEGEINYRS